jgi:hypothetical protein
MVLERAPLRAAAWLCALLRALLRVIAPPAAEAAIPRPILTGSQMVVSPHQKLPLALPWPEIGGLPLFGAYWFIAPAYVFTPLAAGLSTSLNTFPRVG